MFNERIIKALCHQLLVETDPEKARTIADTLRAMVDANVEELQLKMNYLIRHYPEILGEDEG